MALSKRLYRRIFLLSAILIVVELIYLGIRRQILPIDPVILRSIEILLTFVISLLITTVILRLTGDKVWSMFEKEMEVEQRIIISKLYAVSLYTIAFIITFWRAGLSLGNITLFVGLITTGLAFAIRDLLLSFLAWFVILNKKPFQMGDFIRIGDDMGLVTRIGTFFFTLELPRKDEFIKVPNSNVLQKSIRNLGEGEYVQELQFMLKTIPENPSNLLSELQQFIKLRSRFNKVLKCNLGADANNWFIKIEYTTHFDQDHLRALIAAEVARLFHDHLKTGGAQ
jgi:MscS family membrane protein